jgi:hypothetical protein
MVREGTELVLRLVSQLICQLITGAAVSMFFIISALFFSLSLMVRTRHYHHSCFLFASANVVQQLQIDSILLFLEVFRFKLAYQSKQKILWYKLCRAQEKQRYGNK